jgi:hypothetical protein
MVLLRTFVVMFIYAFLMPMWARIAHSVYSVPRGVNPFQLFVMGCLFANPLVTAIKVGQFLMQRLKR